MIIKSKSKMNNKIIKEKMKKYNIKGLSYLLIKNYKVCLAEYFGEYDEISRTKITDETIFQVASLSKPIFATLVMKLYEEKLIDIDIDVNIYLKSFKLKDKKNNEVDITIRELLSHVGGTTVSGFDEIYYLNDAIPSLIEILNGKGKNEKIYVKDISRKYEYSGGGYEVVRLALEDTFNKSLDKIMKEKVFEPLNMNNSSYMIPRNVEIENRLATGHEEDGKPIKDRFYMRPCMAAAGLLSNVNDIAKLGIAIQKSLLEDNFFTREIANEMLTKLTNDSHAIGFRISNDNKVFFHDGVNAGYRAKIIFTISNGDGLVMINNSCCDKIFNDIEKIYGYDKIDFGDY